MDSREFTGLVGFCREMGLEKQANRELFSCFCCNDLVAYCTSVICFAFIYFIFIFINVLSFMCRLSGGEFELGTWPLRLQCFNYALIPNVKTRFQLTFKISTKLL
jgi:hypothetical protein